MKKWILLAGVMVIVALGIVVFALPALGQSPTSPPGQNQGNGSWGSCFGNGGVARGYGMMGGGYIGLGNSVTLKRAADTLSLTSDQLTSRLQQGETLAQIAQVQKVSSDAVVAAILAPQSDMVQIGVKYGYLTQAQAQTLMDQARQWVGQMMTSQLYSSNATPVVPNSGPNVAPNNGYRYGPGGMMGGYFESSPNGGFNGYGYGPGGMMSGAFGGRGMMGW